MNIRDAIHRKIEEAGNLPTLPEIAVKVEKLARDEKASARDLAKVMDHDPALAARVLKAANSVVYGSRTPITSVTYAVARIGFSEVRNIALSLSVLKLFTEKGHMDYSRFWRHSLSVAFASRILQRYAPVSRASGDDFFVAGLLHDIGIVVLDQYFQRLYHPVLEAASQKSIPLCDLENEVLGTDHAKVGSLLLERWRLPETVQKAVCYHHAPDKAMAAQIIAQTVHLSNFVCNDQGMDNGVAAFPSGFSESAWQDLGLSVDHVPAIIKEVNRETAKSDTLVALAEGAK